MSIKVEPKTNMEILDEKIKEFEGSKKAVLRKFQDMEIDAKSTQNIAGQEKGRSYAEGFKADLGKHVNKLGRIVKLLGRACSEEKLQEAEVPALLEQLAELEAADKALMEWGARFGFVKPAPKSRKRKKENAE